MRHLIWIGLLAFFARPAMAAVETPNLTLAYIPSITAVAAYVARDTGLFEKAGLHVKLIAIDQGSTAVAGIVSGSVQISTSLPTNFIQAFAGGLDIEIIANAHIYPTANQVGVLARVQSAITLVADLKGHRVAVNGLQGIQHLLLLHALRKVGVLPGQVSVVEVGFPQMEDALKSGQVDAATISEPYFQRIIAHKVARPIVDLQADVPAGTMGTVYIATRDWIDANPGTVAAFREALSQSVALIKQDPHVATELVQRALHLDASIAADLHIPNLATAATADQMKFWVSLMQEENVLSTPVDIARMVAP